MYFLSQVEYSEGGEITHTGVDEYERHEQEKKLKEYVNSNQVKDLIRLIQVFSVIKPAPAVWIESEDCSIQESVSTDAMEYKVYKDRSGNDCHGTATSNPVCLECGKANPPGVEQTDNYGKSKD